MFEEKYGIDTTGLTRRGNNKSVDPQQHYKMLYNEILVAIIEQLKVRYASQEELKFIKLLNFRKAEEYRKKFPVHALNSLKTVYGNYFDMPRLQSELCVVYSSGSQTVRRDALVRRFNFPRESHNNFIRSNTQLSK